LRAKIRAIKLERNELPHFLKINSRGRLIQSPAINITKENK
jgi:hypothetical protein